MVPSSSSSPSSSRSPTSPPPPPPPPPHHITPIEECEREEQDDEWREKRRELKGTLVAVDCKDEIKGAATPKHNPTPLHQKNSKPYDVTKNWRESTTDGIGGEDGSVSCNNCRPQSRDKISVVPLDTNGFNRHSLSLASPNRIFKSILASLTRKSPKSTDASTSREEQWKIAIAELSHKLILATRKRDEALLEAARLKYSVTELEKKLDKLEVYCHNLKTGLDEFSSKPAYQNWKIYSNSTDHQNDFVGVGDKVIEQFLVSVSEARSSVKLLSRSLTTQLKHMGDRVHERISMLLQPYDVKVSSFKNPKCVFFYLEALLNKVFYEDFEAAGFQKSCRNQILNPIDRCEANYASFNVLKELTWEEVLNKGTRYFSEDFSRFCDRKMSDIVAMLGWNRAWPEPMLQAFFSASKNVWLVHLLANSVHPGLPIFRVDKGSSFDSVYMEDTSGDRAKRPVPATVRIMVAPGFHVYGNVIKSKVICECYNCCINNEKGLTSTPYPY